MAQDEGTDTETLPSIDFIGISKDKYTSLWLRAMILDHL